MKIAITGHTSGIGKSIHDYFSIDNTVVGYSRSNGFDINNESNRKTIIEQSKDFDLFINNAYSDYNDSQLLLLKEICMLWQDTNKMVINISSRYTTDMNSYCYTKKELDKFCESFQYKNLYLVNLKPGLVDTPRVTNVQGNKMPTESILSVIEFILLNKDNFKVHSMCFGK